MKRVLVVEDDAPNRESIVELLADEGYAVLEAQDGLEALRLARDHSPNLILLDLVMPMMDGSEFLAEQWRDPALAAIPVVVLSAVSRDRLSGVEHVAEAISKPFDLDTLLEAVARHVAAAACGSGYAVHESG